jgi:hypothetical protein
MKYSMNKSYLVLLLPCSLLVLGISMFWNPYLTVSEYRVMRYSLWGDPKAKPGIVMFTIKSTGMFTVNYPIAVEVEVVLGEDIEGYFQAQNNITLLFPDSYMYPIEKAQTGFLAGRVSMLGSDRKGAGTISFPYPGSFSTYYVLVNSTSVYIPSAKEPAIFSIENYSSRLQIENTNRTIGIAIMSLAVASIGLILKMIESTPQKTSYSPAGKLLSSARQYDRTIVSMIRLRKGRR